MKILYLGDISPGQTCSMRMKALERLGHQVIGVNTVEPWKRARWISRQTQRVLHTGPIIDAINHEVITHAKLHRPDLVWADKQEFLRPETVVRAKQFGAVTVSFTPDPYFTLKWKRTSFMDEAMRAFDGLVYCKRYEETHYRDLEKPIYYMPLGYCDEVHRPLGLNQSSQWSCPLGFLGGWEPRRQTLLHQIAMIEPTLQVRGCHWDFLLDGKWTLRRWIIMRQFAKKEPFAIGKNETLGRCIKGGEVYGDDYARALSGARISLGFLRRVCPDQHTTRTFEIPACGSLLLSDRTPECQAFFTEGKEAEYFETAEELVDKVRFYSQNETARQRIAAAGRQRCLSSGYSYLERMRGAMNWLTSW